MDKNLEKKIKELEKAGFQVKRVVKTTKKTFEVSEETIEQFMALVKSKDIKVKDAIEEALVNWIKN